MELLYGLGVHILTIIADNFEAYRLINLSKIPKHGDLLPFKPKISIKNCGGLIYEPKHGRVVPRHYIFHSSHTIFLVFPLTNKKTSPSARFHFSYAYAACVCSCCFILLILRSTSFFTKISPWIFSMPYIMVVWSRPPSTSPICGSEALVS